MKIAITSAGNSLESIIDTRFGRCSYFAIYDTKMQTTVFLPNPSKELLEGAGPAAVEFIASHHVDKIVSGEFGMKIKSLLESLSIEMVINTHSSKNISELIEMYK